jgi:hypothetical protein
LAGSGDTPRKLHQIGRLSVEDAGGCAGLRLYVGEFAEQVSDSPRSFFDVLQSVHQSEQLRSTLGSPTQQEPRGAADGREEGADIVDEQVTSRICRLDGGG